MINKNIVWVASYPKSGNTWVRSILSSLLFSDDGIFNFDLLLHIDQFDNEKNFQFVKEMNEEDYSNLNKMEIVSKYWDLSQKKIGSVKDYFFFKTHSANYSYKNINYVNIDHALGCIYLLRDPRDVAISYSKHINQPINEVIKMMIQSNQQIYNPYKTIGVILSRWDFHVVSWIKLNKPKLIIKYEDLLDNTEEMITKIIKFLRESLDINFTSHDKKIQNIIDSTSFDKLKENETNEGFGESSKKSPFFRVGQKMQWKKILDKNQILKIEENFNKTMRDFGYLE